VDPGAVAGVETTVEIDGRDPRHGERRIEVALLGPLAIRRGGRPLALPASRKARALFAYLALAPRAVPRRQLCELLWDEPSDPRGELRWCLSKIRALVDDETRRRVVTGDDAVRLDLGDCHVDAVEVARASGEGFERLPVERNRELSMLFGGELLEGLEIERSAAFSGWLVAQRRRFRGAHLALLEQLVRSVPQPEAFGDLEKWLQLAPFDRRAHESLLAALARLGRVREGEDHLATAAALFEAEGLECRSLRELWRSLRVECAPSHAVPDAARDAAAAVAGTAARRASIAVMPLHDRPGDGSATRSGAADALAHDVITRLAKLRSMFVIAQGTVFALHERGVAPDAAGRMLNVDYIVSGSVRLSGRNLTVAIELAETRTARVVWSELFNRTQDDVFLVLDAIGNSIVASIASEIETVERNRAILRPPNSLDAWEAHHRGLWHAYRFNQADNDRARHFFETAIRLDPTFARAHAGLSFAHFQDAFQRWTDPEPAIERAFESAGQSLMADDRDPAAHWALGRALWLRHRHEESIAELERAIDLSPNFALGHYTLAFVQSQAGDPLAAIASSDYSRELSPFDPLLFGMLGARAIALARLGRFDEAADWAVRAASRPNAHIHIYAIAACVAALAGRLDEAGAWVGRIRRARPRYRVDDLLAAFRLAADGEALFRDGARRIGLE
jgi:DNA-binding SARP family transcriptional activator